MTRRLSEPEPITGGHAVGAFDCGSPAQTEWLQKRALQAHRAGTGFVYVVRRLADDAVVGYYALATGAVAPADAPERITNGADRYDVPVIILTRLGVDVSEQGQGLRTALRVAVLRAVATAAGIVGVRALLIHCEGPAAEEWYLRRAEFEESPTDPLHLMLLMKDLRHALSQHS